MPRVQNRPGITTALAAASVVDASNGGMLTDNIQLVYILDDLSEQLAQIPPPRRYGTFTRAALAGEFAGMELIPPADSPVVVERIRNSGTVDAVVTIGTYEWPNNRAQTVQGFVSGPPTRAAVFNGTAPFGQPATSVSVIIDANEELNATNLGRGLIVPPGQKLIVYANAQNTANVITLFWREFPE